jgi:hypothetical protein
MADIRQAVERYIAGDKMNDIAAHFGVTQPTVSYWVKRHGLTIGAARYKKALRHRGRRMDKEPSKRDQEIILFSALGVPFSDIIKGKGYEVSRARIGYIVKTWKKRGWVPPLPFKPGQIVKTCGREYIVKKVHDHKSGLVFDRVTAEEIDNFEWYQNGAICEIINEPAAG